MKNWKRIRKSLRGRRLIVVIGTTCVVTGLLIYAAVVTLQGSTKSKTSHTTSLHTRKVSQQIPSGSSATSPQSTTEEVSSSQSVASPKSSSSPTTPQSTTSPAPTPQPFAVSYVVLSQPNLVCSSEGSYIAQIGDVIVGLASSSGGTITYGFEVSGDIDDTWGGYRHSSNVAAGVWSTSFNQMYWGSTSEPHMAYTELIPWGHGAGAIRAVVYTPNTVYSQWFAVPAQEIGQSC